MSDPTEPVAAVPTKKSEEPKRTRREKWRRRFFVFVTLLVLISLSVRLLLHVLFPAALDRAARLYGLSATYDRLDLSILSADVGLWGLRFTPVDGGPAVLSTSYCRGAISLWSLFKLELYVWRVEAEDAEVRIDRLADGSLPLVERLLGASKPTPAPAAKSADPSLASPVTINTLRLQNARLRFVDAYVSPQTDVTVQMDLLVRGVGATGEKTRVELQVNSPEALAALYVNGTGESRQNQLDADVEVKMVGLNLEPARAYLAPLGIVPRSDDVSASGRGKLMLRLTPSAGATTKPTSRSATTLVSLPPSTLQASLALDDVTLSANSIEAGGIRTVRIEARELSPGAVRIDRIELGKPRARVGRTEAGTISFAGVEFGTAPPAPSTRPTTVAATTRPTAMPIVEVDRFDVRDASVTVEDRAVAPATTIELAVPQLTLEHLSTDPTQAATPARLTLLAAAPTLARQIKVSGTIAAATPQKSAEFKVDVAGINADALAPYLAPLGIGEEINDGTFTMTVGGRYALREGGRHVASLDLADARFIDGGVERFAMNAVRVGEASFDPAANRVRLDGIELRGPAMPLSRDAAGVFHALGFRTIAATPGKTPAPSTTPTTVATNAPMPVLPTLEIGSFVWQGSSFTIDDAATGGAPLSLKLDDVTARIDGLVIGKQPADATPGRVSFAVRAPGLIETLNVGGTVGSAGDAFRFDVAGKSTGITLDRVRSLLTSAGVQPQLRDGAARFEANGSLRQDGNGRIAAEFALKNAALEDGATQWLAVAGASVRGASFDGRRVTVEVVELDAPQALIQRDVGGHVAAAGMRFVSSPAVATTRPTVAADVVVAPTPTRLDLTLPIVGELKRFAVRGASLRLEDESTLPAARVAATVDATLDRVVVSEAAPPAAYAVRVKSPGLAQTLDIAGTFSLAPTAQSVTARIAATELSGSAIEPYLPPTIGLDLAQRSVAADFAASFRHDPRGGSSGTLELRDAAVRRGDVVEAGVRLARATIDRVDLPGKEIAINELVGEGVRFEASQDEAGLHALGVLVSQKPLREVPKAKPTMEAVAGDQIANVESLVRASSETLPLLRIESLSLGADRLAFATPAVKEPLVVTGVTLTNAGEPIELGGTSPEELPPVHLVAAATVERWIKSAKADVRFAPFANEPMATVDVAVGGIRGEGLADAIPALAGKMDAGGLRDARFATSAEARFKYARRGAFGIDLTRDVTADVTVRQTTLTSPDVERPLVGVQEVRVDKLRYSPATGALVVGAIEVAKPTATLVRDADGVHVAGLTLNVLKPASTQPTTASVEVATAEAAAPPEAAPATPSAAGAAEFRIDRLTVGGADVRIEDRVNEPHSVLPITDLDVEVVGLSTRALGEARPVRMSAVVGSGKVTLPPRRQIAGAAPEERNVFAEASANANLTLFPKPSGYVRASVSGFELTAVRGLTSEYGITLGGGTFDGRVDVRMQGADTFVAKVWPTFNELRMSEAPNGPIQKTFRLPAPPDVMISTLEDVDGSLTFPFTVPIDAGKVNVGAIVGSAIGSVGKVLAEAMVAAPLKAGKLLGGLVGLDVSSDRTKAIEPVTIDFAHGESQLGDGQIRALAALRERMRKDPTLEVTLQHELGADDVQVAESRVNLQADDGRAIADQLLAQKRDLQRRYAERTADLSLALASQDANRSRVAASSLRSVAGQLEATEEGLDGIFDLLRPGADRQASRRTKAAAILLADLRLRAVQDWLMAADLKEADGRIRRSSAVFNPSESGTGRVKLVLTRRAKS